MRLDRFLILVAASVTLGTAAVALAQPESACPTTALGAAAPGAEASSLRPESAGPHPTEAFGLESVGVPEAAVRSTIYCGSTPYPCWGGEPGCWLACDAECVLPCMAGP